MSKRSIDRITCHHCQNARVMDILGITGDLENHDQEDGPSHEAGYYYEILKCPSCEKVNIRSYYWHDMMDGEEDVTYTHIYPTENRMPLGLPSEIKKAYDRAIKIKPIDELSYAVVLRQILELVCKDKKATGKVLADQIKDLARKGEIPKNLVTVAQKVKQFGNMGAHAGNDLTKREVVIAEALCRAVLEYIYTAPHLAQVAEETLKAKKAPAKKIRTKNI